MKRLSQKRIQHAMRILGIMFSWNKPLKERQKNFCPVLLNEVSLGAICDYLQEVWEAMDEAVPFLPDEQRENFERLQKGLVEDDLKIEPH